MRTGELTQRYHGLYLGLVLDVNDPNGLGRVRVRTDQTSDTSDDPVWATVSRPLAGNALSVYFTPREGDQVVVGYLVGDAREPIILGYAHSTQREPPKEVAPKKHGIVTGIGSVVFDEAERKITVTFTSTGPAPGASVELTDAALRLQGPGGLGNIVLSSAGVTITGPSIQLAGAAIQLVGSLQIAPTPPTPGVPSSGKGVDIDTAGKPFCINGDAVVLAKFLAAFDAHTHAIVSPAVTGPAVPPALPGPPITTIPCP